MRHKAVYYSTSSFYMFRVSTTPIVRSTQNCNCSLQYWSYFLCSYLPPKWPSWPHWREVAAQKIWPVLEAVVTVLCTPDDGRGWHTKHVEWTCRIINRLLCGASRWTVINIKIWSFEIMLEELSVFGRIWTVKLIMMLVIVVTVVMWSLSNGHKG